MRRKKLLHIVPYAFYPPDGGGKHVVYNNLKSLSENFDIDLVLFLGNEERHREGLDELRNFCKVHIVERIGNSNAGHKSFFEMLVIGLVFFFPWMLKRYPVDGIEHFYANANLKELIGDDYDVIQLEHSWWYHPALCRRKGKLVLVEHNYEVEYWKHLGLSLVRQGDLLRGILLYLTSIKVYFQEKSALKDADLILAISEREMVKIQRRFKIKDKIHPLSTGLISENYKDFYKINYSLADKQGVVQLIYIGSLDLPQAVDSIKFFVEDVALFLNSFKYRLKIIGRNPSDELTKIAKVRQEMDLIGYVDDVRPHIKMSDIYIVPLRYGAGMRIKILEAMMMGMPLVSTSKGAEGIDLAQTGILIADNAADFAQCIRKLAVDEKLRADLGRRNKVYAEESFNWKTNFQTKTITHYLNL